MKSKKGLKTEKKMLSIDREKFSNDQKSWVKSTNFSSKRVRIKKK